MKAIFKGLWKKGFAYIISFITVISVLVGISWLITCGVTKLITLCFGIDFTWGIGTGVWFSLFLIGTVTGGKK